MTTTRAIAFGIGLLLGSVPVSAHHAFSAEFDVTRPIRLQGTLVKWEMINPHSWFHLDVKEAGWQSGPLDDRGWQSEPTHAARRDEKYSHRRDGDYR